MLEERLATLLAANPTLKIATLGGRVSPWLAAAFFAEDGLFTLQLMIEAQGKTLTNIRSDPRVAVMLESGDPMALFAQGEGRATLVGDAGDAFRAALIAKTPPSAPLVSLPNLLPVRVRIERWLLTDVRAGWLPAKELRAPALAVPTRSGLAARPYP